MPGQIFLFFLSPTSLKIIVEMSVRLKALTI